MTSSFDIFLLGTHISSGSPINHLPEDVLITIANSLADSYNTYEVAGWFYGLKRHLARGVTEPQFGNGACASGNLSMVIWINAHYPESITASAMCIAASHGHRHIMEWLHAERGYSYGRNPTAFAARGGQLEIYKWMIEEGASITSQDRYTAIANGHTHIVAWLNTI